MYEAKLQKRKIMLKADKKEEIATWKLSVLNDIISNWKSTKVEIAWQNYSNCQSQHRKLKTYRRFSGNRSMQKNKNK